jgi:ATPase subunit of ABC transporter with duplicated ATPase domains
MLTVSQLSKSFGGRVLFDDAALQVNKGDRIALIGPNGTGKTTLFSILLGLEIPDKGEIVLQRGVVVGYLPQEIASAGNQTVIQIATTPLGDLPADQDHSSGSEIHQIEAKAKRIQRMDKLDAPATAQARVSFRFPSPERSGLKVIELRGISHAYGENVVYKAIDYTVERNQRTVLVGPNGAGKSTLLKLLGGVLPVQKGTHLPGLNARISYFSQHRVHMLGLDRSVFEEACETGMPEQSVRSVLGAFLFPGDDVFKPVRVLSGGEKSRLALAKLLLDRPNCLLMDEPTTHLDMASIEALIHALRHYNGTTLFVSHDVYFIRKNSSECSRASKPEAARGVLWRSTRSCGLPSAN